jgi:hypothetical protein
VGGGDRTFALAGVCGVPPDAVSAALNVTVTQPSAAGDLRLYPAGSPLPGTSTINFGAGQTRANNAILSLGGGAVTVHNDAGGAVHVIVDVTGYFR